MKERKKCHECGSDMEPGNLDSRLLHTLQGQSILCTNIPIHRCPKCGMVYFSAAVSRLFDRIRKGIVVPQADTKVELAAIPVAEMLVGTS